MYTLGRVYNRSFSEAHDAAREAAKAKAKAKILARMGQGTSAPPAGPNWPLIAIGGGALIGVVGLVLSRKKS